MHLCLPACPALPLCRTRSKSPEATLECEACLVAPQNQDAMATEPLAMQYGEQADSTGSTCSTLAACDAVQLRQPPTVKAATAGSRVHTPADMPGAAAAPCLALPLCVCVQAGSPPPRCRPTETFLSLPSTCSTSTEASCAPSAACALSQVCAAGAGRQGVAALSQVWQAALPVA